MGARASPRPAASVATISFKCVTMFAVTLTSSKKALVAIGFGLERLFAKKSFDFLQRTVDAGGASVVAAAAAVDDALAVANFGTLFSK